MWEYFIHIGHIKLTAQSKPATSIDATLLAASASERPHLNFLALTKDSQRKEFPMLRQR